MMINQRLLSTVVWYWTKTNNSYYVETLIFVAFTKTSNRWYFAGNDLVNTSRYIVQVYYYTILLTTLPSKKIVSIWQLPSTCNDQKHAIHRTEV